MNKHSVILLFLVILVNSESVNFKPVGLCVHTTKTDDQIEDYVRYRGFVPRMSEATVCSWIETTNFLNKLETIVSYAPTSILHFAYIVGVQNLTYLQTYIMNNFYPQTVPALGEKFHFCQWFSSIQEQGGYYINGMPLPPFRYSSGPLTGGGDMIFGQEQDDVNAGVLDPTQAFQGNITNFMIWPRILSSKEIYEIAGYCSCPTDYNIVLSLDRVELFGQAYYSIPDECPTI